jgi:hypothetical protein
VRPNERWWAVVVGENIHRHPMSLTSLECQVSELVNGDTCPRPTTQVRSLSPRGSSQPAPPSWSKIGGGRRGGSAGPRCAVVGRGHVSLLAAMLDTTWHSKTVRGIGRLLRQHLALRGAIAI